MQENQHFKKLDELINMLNNTKINEEIMTTVKERVDEYCKYAKISVREFEKSINVSYGYFYHLTKNGVSHDKVKSIISKYPDLNIDWLIYGEGEMLKSQVQNVNGHHNAATMNGDITQNYAQGTDMNLALMNEISEHRKIINKSQEQIDELIGIIRELAGKLKVES